MKTQQHTVTISTAYWSDHADRLWETTDSVHYEHVDGEWHCSVIKENKTTTTLLMCSEGVHELYSDASYQNEVSLEDGNMRAYAASARRVMAAIRRQVDLPLSFLECWG